MIVVCRCMSASNCCGEGPLPPGMQELHNALDGLVAATDAAPAQQGEEEEEEDGDE